MTFNYPLLKIEDLGVFYKSRNWKGAPHYVKAVNGVSFEIRKGQTVGLVGESGSGKSTIGRSIVHLTPINDGRILWNGRSVTSLSRKDIFKYRSKVQMIFQDPFHTLNPRMNISTILQEPLRIHQRELTKKKRLDYIVECLERVGLSSHSLMKYPHQFSGGQRQRIGIARALSVKPDLIICDEAVSALDVSVQAQIVNLLQDLQDEFGFSYLFIAHDLAVVEHMSDYVLVMQEGCVVEQGTPIDIYHNPSHPYTKRLLESVPLLPSLT